MLRFGAATAEVLPPILALEAEHIPLLDEKKGWVGYHRSKNTLKILMVGGPMRPRNDRLYRLVDKGKRVRLYLNSQEGKAIKS